MDDCIFCKMVKGDIPVDFLLETDELLAFRDINPQAPVHILIIPKMHIPKISDIDAGQEILVGKMVQAANRLAEQEGFAEGGYRLVFNCGKDGGQEVFHIHLHLLGGRKMNWPPG